MRILLDTHALIWLLSDSPRLSAAIRERLSATDVELFFSSVSILEIAIKHSLKPEVMPCAPDEIRADAVASGLQEIKFDSFNAKAVGDLPWLHRDPFDRMLVAQARTEKMLLLTHDDAVIGYGNGIMGF